MKEQILFWYLGLGWKDTHCPCTSQHLFDHFIQTVIPLANNCTTPDEQQLDQKSAISDSIQIGQFNNSAEFKARAHAMRDDHEREGQGDCWSDSRGL